MFYLGSATGVVLGFVLGTKLFNQILKTTPQVEINGQEPVVTVSNSTTKTL